MEPSKLVVSHAGVAAGRKASIAPQPHHSSSWDYSSQDPSPLQQRHGGQWQSPSQVSLSYLTLPPCPPFSPEMLQAG